MNPRVQAAMKYLEEHLDQEVSVDEVARFVKLSASHLSHLFKAETGSPPMQCLRSLRRQKAKQLLESTFLSVKEIMRKVGIADESHFSRDFKKAFGASPLRYRERYLDRDRGKKEQLQSKTAGSAKK